MPAPYLQFARHHTAHHPVPSLSVRLTLALILRILARGNFLAWTVLIRVPSSISILPQVLQTVAASAMQLPAALCILAAGKLAELVPILTKKPPRWYHLLAPWGLA